MKTSELAGFQLDWAVAKAEGEKAQLHHGEIVTWKIVAYHEYRQVWRPSTDWAQGGLIIERERIALYLNGDDEWTGEDGWKRATGPTPLIAAMRCYVAFTLGDEVELPEELNQ